MPTTAVTASAVNANFFIEGLDGTPPCSLPPGCPLVGTQEDSSLYVKSAESSGIYLSYLKKCSFVLPMRYGGEMGRLKISGLGVYSGENA